MLDGRTYLVVDEAPAVRESMGALLAKQGISADRVCLTGGAESAMAAFRDTKPDVVFLGVDLPDVDGDEVAAWMLEKDPEVKIVAITALPEDDERVTALRMEGAFEILTKPVHAEDIEEILRLLEADEDGAGRIL